MTSGHLSESGNEKWIQKTWEIQRFWICFSDQLGWWWRAGFDSGSWTPWKPFGVLALSRGRPFWRWGAVRGFSLYRLQSWLAIKVAWWRWTHYQIIPNGYQKKIQAAGLENVRVVKRDALDTRLDAASIDKVLLFGVIPFPSLPLKRLLPEMHRILKTEGTLAVWLFPFSGWVPKWILQSGLFTYVSKRNGVYNYRRC